MHTKLNLPLLPLRDIVVFPSMVIPLFVGRDKSITALNDVMKNEKKIILVTQKNSEVDDPKKNDVFNYGCESNILQLLKLPDGTVKVLVEGVKRVKVLDFKEDEKFITCEFEYQNDQLTEEKDLFPLALTAIRRLEKLSSINKKVPTETINNIKLLKDPSKIADNIASHLNTTIIEKQQLFETLAVKKRLNAVIKIMENEASIIGVEKRIRGRVKTQMEKTQREYYLNEQLKAIQKELGEIEEGKDESTNLEKAILKSKMPKSITNKCMAELKKLKNMSPMSAEATVVRNYLDWMVDLPWYKKNKINVDLNKALEMDRIFLNPTINLQQVSNLLGVSQRNLSHIINNSFNKTFRDLINDHRISEVKLKLIDKDFEHMSILGIALECGFNSEASFYRIFKKKTGLSPKEFIQRKNRD